MLFILSCLFANANVPCTVHYLAKWTVLDLIKLKYQIIFIWWPQIQSDKEEGTLSINIYTKFKNLFQSHETTHYTILNPCVNQVVHFYFIFKRG